MQSAGTVLVPCPKITDATANTALITDLGGLTINFWTETRFDTLEYADSILGLVDGYRY